MATASPSPIFSSLTGIWSLLALRSDIDDIILELLGRFSLEKVYADADKESYADLILTLLVQLRVIFFIQRLTLPPGGTIPVDWSLGFLVSWEVTVRTVEFILQIVLEAREVLWDSPLRDEYLSRLVLSTVQILLLHPKTPPNSRLRDRRDRFARVHRALERVCDNYPDTSSSFLAVCRAIADALRAEPNALSLPPRLKQELPSLTGDLVRKRIFRCGQGILALNRHADIIAGEQLVSSARLPLLVLRRDLRPPAWFFAELVVAASRPVRRGAICCRRECSVRSEYQKGL